VTLSGNSLVVAVQQGSGTGTLSISDDKGNAYNLAKANDDGRQTASVYYAANVIAGAQKITLSFAGGGADYVSAVAAEFYNVAAASALDGTAASPATATGTSVSAGNLTTASDNDLIFQYATQDTDGTNTAWTQGSSPWALLATDFFDAQAAQYQVQPVHGSITPAFAQGSSKRFNTVAIALKSAAAGTPPAPGIRVVHLMHNHVPQTPQPNPFTLQSPSTGNLIVVAWIGAPGCHIGSVSDGNGNSYTSTIAPFGNGGSGDSQLYYAASATTSTNMSGPTLSVSGCDGASHNAMVFDVSGAAASPFDAAAGVPTASGDQTNAGNVTTVTITPSTANGLVFTQTGVNSHTLVSVTPGNFLSSENVPDIATGAVDNNNGWAINYNTSTSSETFVYGTKSGQLDPWASIAVAFQGAGSPPPPSFDFSLSNSGNKTVVQGQAVSNTITVTLVSGTAQSVSFSASGLPTGATASFSPPSCSPTCSSTLTMTTSASTPTGSSTITVTGAAGSLSRTTTFTLTVNAPPPSFDFSLSNGGNQTAVQGQSVSNTITATLVSGTAQSVLFLASGLPAGAIASFSPALCSPTCSSTLTLMTSALTPAGSSTITVTGLAGSLSRTTTFTLTVNAAPTTSFSIPQDGLAEWLTTAKTDPSQIGYARVQLDTGTSRPSGLAIFGFRSGGALVSEASVSALAAIQSGRIYAEMNGPSGTGIAFANPNGQDAVISFYFTDSAGTDFGQASFTLSANHQMSAFLNEAPFNGRVPMLGTFSFSSSVPVGVIALRGFTNERSEFLMTTLPVVPIGVSTNATLLPHFAGGGGWTTQIILTNPSDNQITGTVQFFSPGSLTQSAAALSMVVNGAAGSSFNYAVPARASVRLVTGNSAGTVQVGTVRINPSGGIVPAALAIFSFKSNGVTVSEAGVSALPAATVFRMYAEAAGASTQMGSTQTGVAIANPSTVPVAINLELTRLDGSSLGPPVTVTVPASGQIARFIQELFPTLPATFQGLLKTTATAPVGMIGLRSRYNERGDFLITTTPPRNEDVVSPGADVVFPHIVGGGGYTTQVIVFGQSGSGDLWLNSRVGELLGSQSLQRIQ